MSQDHRKKFGNAVRDLRKKGRLSQMVLAERADLSLTYVSEMERGLSSPTLGTIIHLSRALGVSSWELVRLAGV